MATKSETTTVDYVQDVATGALYDGIVTSDFAAACKKGPVLAETKTQRDEYGQASGSIWVVAPDVGPGPVPGEYKLVTVIKVNKAD